MTAAVLCGRYTTGAEADRRARWLRAADTSDRPPQRVALPRSGVWESWDTGGRHESVACSLCGR